MVVVDLVDSRSKHYYKKEKKTTFHFSKFRETTLVSELCQFSVVVDFTERFVSSRTEYCCK